MWAILSKIFFIVLNLSLTISADNPKLFIHCNNKIYHVRKDWRCRWTIHQSVTHFLSIWVIKNPTKSLSLFFFYSFSLWTDVYGAINVYYLFHLNLFHHMHQFRECRNKKQIYWFTTNILLCEWHTSLRDKYILSITTIYDFTI